ncbi:hypothetical protein GGR53DRAFT_466569 [Hypoxylon sp. FL1150]|nr:hypothetical protein GGR53DRAFT_466569 [Hypoxylon sp. FL1150]
MPTQIPHSLDDVPLQGGKRLELYQAFADYDNYYEVLQVLSKHAIELGNQSSLKKALDQLQFDRELGRKIAVLLHAIPRGLLEALILGTVGYYFASAPYVTRECYDADGPGTYVAAMTITGRHGRFTNVEEDEKLVVALRKYCDAYAGQKARQGGPPASQTDVDLDTFARNVDKTFGSRPGSKKDQSFERRCVASRNQGSSRLAYHKQGPLMIGCSNQLDERMGHHDPYSSSGLSQTTYTWALTLCLISSELNLIPEVIVKPVIRTWENEYLGPSEVLVSALGLSYVFQDGFNVVGGGSQKGDKQSSVLLEAKEHVFVTKPWFRDNLEATQKELEKRLRYVKDVDACVDFPTTKLQTALREYTVTLWRVRDMSQQLDAKYAEAQQRLEEAEEYLKQLRKRIEAKKHLSYIVSSLLGKPPHDFGEPPGDAGTSLGGAGTTPGGD